MGLVVAQDIPFECFSEQRHVDTRPAEILVRQVGEHLGKKLKDQIFEYRDHVADDDEQSALPNPFGGAGMLLREACPEVFLFTHACVPSFVRFSLGRWKK